MQNFKVKVSETTNKIGDKTKEGWGVLKLGISNLLGKINDRFHS